MSDWLSIVVVISEWELYFIYSGGSFLDLIGQFDFLIK